MPPEIEEMIQYGLSKGVKLMAYAYPVLPFQGPGGEPTVRRLHAIPHVGESHKYHDKPGLL